MDEDSTAPPAPGRREQRKRETRRAIKDAALDLALDRGMESLTVEAISSAADVSPRTFFNYFSSKEDALVPESAEAAAELGVAIVARPREEPPLRAVREAIRCSNFFGAVHLDRERMQARQRLVHAHLPLLSRQLAQYASLEQTFAGAFAERLGTDHDELKPALLAAVAVGVLRVAIRRWTAGEDRSLVEQIDAAFARLEHANLLGPPPPGTA